MALTTLANVKAWLEILPATTTNDVLLTRLIDAASAYIESWLNRKMNSASYAEIRNGNGKNYITVGNYPIISVQSVLIGGVTQTILSQSDYVNVGVKFEERRIFGQNLIFPQGMNNISISYTAGFAVIPSDIEQACIELTALRYKNSRGDRIGVSSKSLAGETVSYFSGDMSESTKSLLLQWRNVVPT